MTMMLDWNDVYDQPEFDEDDDEEDNDASDHGQHADDRDWDDNANSSDNDEVEKDGEEIQSKRTVTCVTEVAMYLPSALGYFYWEHDFLF